MVKAYDELGMTDLRDDAARVMKKNFPDSRFFSGSSGKVEEAWWKFW